MGMGMQAELGGHGIEGWGEHFEWDQIVRLEKLD